MLMANVMSTTLAQGDLHDALRRVRHAICQEETRYYLNGVYVHAGDRRLHFVATDGHRLARVSLAVDADLSALVPVILPRAFIEAAIKATGKGSRRLLAATLEFAPSKVVLRLSGQDAIEAEPIEGTYPDYQRVMPTGEPPHGKTLIAGEPLQQACRAISVYSVAVEPKGTRPVVRVSLGCENGSGKLTLTRNLEPEPFRIGGAPSYGPAMAVLREVRLPETADGAPPPDIGFDARYLAQLAEAADSAVLRWHNYGGALPALFEPCGDDSAKFLLMPCRL